jgi:hypothetical protein
VADRHAGQIRRLLDLQTPGNLLRRPVPLDPLRHVGLQCLVPGARTPDVGPPVNPGERLGAAGNAASVGLGVTPQLPADRADMPPQHGGDLRILLALKLPSMDDIPLRSGKMLVGHRADSFRLGLWTSLNLRKSPRDVLLFFHPVALTMRIRHVTLLQCQETAWIGWHENGLDWLARPPDVSYNAYALAALDESGGELDSTGRLRRRWRAQVPGGLAKHLDLTLRANTGMRMAA